VSEIARSDDYFKFKWKVGIYIFRIEYGAVSSWTGQPFQILTNYLLHSLKQAKQYENTQPGHITGERL
jgi:hypothetical protein